MKKIVWNYLIVTIVMSAVFTACDNDDATPETTKTPETSIVSNNISVAVSYIDAEVENVKLLVNSEINVDWVLDEETGMIIGSTTTVTGEEIARGSFSGGILTMNLPATVDNKYLQPMFDDMEVPAGVSMSNSNTKGTGGVFLVGYDRNGNETGLFFYGKLDEETKQIIMAALAYVDNDLIITGSFSDDDGIIKSTISYDCNFRKGWNFMYVLLSSDGEGRLIGRTTTENPGGLKWVYGKLN
jgi:hypothetical protein